MSSKRLILCGYRCSTEQAKIRIEDAVTCLGSYPRPMLEVIARDAYTNGVIWVCAAGNEVEVVVAPAMYPGTIAVRSACPTAGTIGRSAGSAGSPDTAARSPAAAAAGIRSTVGAG